MQSRVCASVICLSVPAWTTAVKFAAVAQPAGDISQLLHGTQRMNAGSAKLSAYVVAEYRLVWLKSVLSTWFES